jgi:hypothetical protein
MSNLVDAVLEAMAAAAADQVVPWIKEAKRGAVAEAVLGSMRPLAAQALHSTAPGTTAEAALLHYQTAIAICGSSAAMLFMPPLSYAQHQKNQLRTQEHMVHAGSAAALRWHGREAAREANERVSWGHRCRECLREAGASGEPC